jgi:hypothetical protein
MIDLILTVWSKIDHMKFITDNYPELLEGGGE